MTDALGPLEAQVMDALWLGGAGTPRDVVDFLRDDAPRAYTTIMTTLARLHRKGVLDRTRDGRAWRYRPCLTGAEYGRAQAATRARVLVGEHGRAGLVAVVEAAREAGLLEWLVRLASAAQAESGPRSAP